MSRNVGEQHGMAKLTKADVEDIHRMIDLGYPLRRIAAKFKVHESLISAIKTGARWKETTK